MAEPTEKLKQPLETSTALAIGVWLLVVLAMSYAWATGDKPLAQDLSKNFVGPGFLIILGYYFGASSSGKRKDETIAAQAEQLGQQQ